MKVVLILFAALVVVALAAEEVKVIKYENDRSGPNSYRFLYELSDGTKREEEGELMNVGTDTEALSVKGSYTWKDPKKTYHVSYVADEKGYRPIVKIMNHDLGSVPPDVYASLLGK